MRVRKPGLIAVVVILLATIVSTVAPVSAETTESDVAQEAVEAADHGRLRPRPKPPAPTLDWVTCYEDVTEFTGAAYECATLKAPLNYARPFHPRVNPTIDVALVRLPAQDPANRQGALLLNPGGPGGSGVDFALFFGPAAGSVFGPDVPAQFDLVGFDPRGIARSTQVRCFKTIEDAVSVIPPVGFPLNADEQRAIMRSDAALARACRQSPQARLIGPHASTANVARDMDLVREAMGDEQMNFLGLSYGTFVGAVYANLFPERVRAVVVDGVLDPVAWVNLERQVPFSTRLRSDEGAAETLVEFFAQCEAAAPGNCALAPGAEARFDAVAQHLRDNGPIEFIDPDFGDLVVLTYQDLIGATLGNLYNPFGYGPWAGAIAFLESVIAGEDAAEMVAADPAGAAQVARFARAFMDEPEEPYDNFVESFPAVGCVDTSNPRNYRVWQEQGELAEAEHGYFGRLWTWASSSCARWPFKDRNRYEGPWDNATANPVLIMSTLYDPATRLEGAETLRSLMPNSALVTADVPGHTTLGVSICAGLITGQYFLDPSIAYEVDGTLCPAEFNAFDLTAGPPPDDGGGAAVARAGGDMAAMEEARAIVMEGVLRPPSMALLGAG